MNTRFVAEVSSNHGRDLDRCMRFVDVSADVGCAAVKFQQFEIDRLFAPEAIRANPALARRREWELPPDFNRTLAERAHERGIQFASTPFHPEAVALLEPWVDFFKLASYQLLWTDFLTEVGRTGKPIVLATGMATLDEVERAVEALKRGGCEDLTLLHCVSLYPTLVKEANLAAIATLRDAFGCEAGWSDHTVAPEVVTRAVRRWDASLVEFHLDLEGMGEEYGAGHCWLPDEICRVILELKEEALEALPASHEADGDGVKEPRLAEHFERGWRTDPSDGLRPLLATRAGLRGMAA